MFCPKCQTLMFPKNGKFICSNSSCGYERDLNTGETDVALIANPNKKKVIDTLVLENVTETIPKTKVDCPKCGHREALWIMRQTRAADEPTTRIYRCTSCNYTWREY